MNKKPKVVALGEILWDIFPDKKCLGGAPLNFVYHCQNLGLDATIVSAIGRDVLGEEILQNADRLGINTDHIQKTIHPTGTVQVEVDASGQPTYQIVENVAWDNISFDPKMAALAKSTDVFCFGSLASRCEKTKSSLLSFIEKLPKEASVIFDINLRQNYYSKKLLFELLSACNVLKINDEELLILQGLLEVETSTTESLLLETLLQKFDLKLIVLTKGSKGSLLFSENEMHEFSTSPVTIEDTVGAGDSFTAVVCFGLLNNWSLEKINTSASRLAAFVCSRSGATPKIKDIWEILKT